METNNLQEVKLIIFDLDGTLIDSEKDIVMSLKYCLGRFNLKRKTYDQLKTYIGKGVRELIKDATGIDKGSLYDAVLNCFKDYYSKHLVDHTRLYPGVKHVLDHFSNKSLAIATNKPGILVTKILRHFRIKNYFQYIVDGDNQDHRKPAPGGIHRILEHCNATPHETLLVGDMSIDILTARNARVKSCAVTYGIGKVSEILDAKPDFVIDNIEKLKEIIV